MAPHQRRIIFGLLAIIIIGLSLKLIDRQRQMAGFDFQGLLDGFKYTTALENANVDIIVQSNVASFQVKTDTLEAQVQPSMLLININTADPERLMALPGIGPVLAAEIVAHRTAHGPFRTAEDLLEVKGIGPNKLSKLLGRVEF